ncbi:ribosomal protein L11 methyltransferase [Limosilactobacillus mucosae LM1]|uniref:Ribosomal protein L11 methyltransferase n=1 Tax=Limosilactobacillus mucosae LM1 TaxID=1130798 RepID=A0A0D4CLH3_LIMMU|nr:50S ribosomal protein L11 methyltransferase [Limosilactobacillus mucosae]AJT50770.1 ribosomal protein L11 methyltransferase [Limosilactobacillus mucosae LM1]
MNDWTAVTVETSTEAVDAVSYILTDTGAAGIQIEDAADFAKLKPGRYGDEIIDPSSIPHRQTGAAVTGYYPSSVFVPELLPGIKQRVLKLKDFGLDPMPAEVKSEAIENQDWKTAWEKYYHPVRVTRTLTVVPEWEDYQPSSDEKLLILDPGMAFGTGTHPTTQLMLQALELTVRGGESMLDVGTGSGVLSIAAKLLGVGKIKAYDIDEVAVRSAKKNLALNPAAKDVEIGVNSLLDGIHDQDADLIVANILAEIILPLIPQAYENLKPGGHFLTSGIINDKFDEVAQGLRDGGFKIDETMRIKDWYGIIAHKPTHAE